MPACATDKSDLLENRRFARQLGWVVALKLLALFLLWAFFFSGGHRIRIDEKRMTEKLAGYAGTAQSLSGKP